ncbi:MAG: dihydrofolate reductase [Methyloceanibacter sp.]
MNPTPPVIALVVAMAENRAIGLGGNLPWHLSSDMRYFRKITMGKPIVMGRLTFKSLGRALPGRVNIVLTRDRDFVAPGAIMAHSLAEGLAQARRAAEEAGVDEIMIIGGEDVFREVLPEARRIYLTEVHAAPEADTWFHQLDGREWREVFREDHAPGPKDDHPFSFVVLERT